MHDLFLFASNDNQNELLLRFIGMRSVQLNGWQRAIDPTLINGLKQLQNEDLHLSCCATGKIIQSALIPFGKAFKLRQVPFEHDLMWRAERNLSLVTKIPAAHSRTFKMWRDVSSEHLSSEPARKLFQNRCCFSSVFVYFSIKAINTNVPPQRTQKA